VPAIHMLQTHMDRQDTRQGQKLSVHAVPSLGQKDRGVGIPSCDPMVAGLDKHRGLRNIGLAGKDAGIEVMEECLIAVDGVTETTRSENQDGKLSLMVEPPVDHHSSLAGRQVGRNNLVAYTSERHCLVHMARQVARDMEVAQLL